MKTQHQPRNVQEAIAQALRLERAEQLLKDGYTFHKDADSEVVAVVKPGTTAAAYWLNMIEDGCDCPDSMKGNVCKHELAWGLLQKREQAERANEAAMMEAQAAEHDASRLNMELPELPTLTVRAVLESLQMRIVADLEQAETQYAAKEFWRFGQTRNYHRLNDLQGALDVVNGYLGRELVGKLDLTPAPCDFDSPAVVL